MSSEPDTEVPPRRLRHWKRWLIGGVVAVVVLAVGVPYVYIHFIEGPAPARFSTITDAPRICPSSLLKVRATVSCTAPGPNGTMMRMTRCAMAALLKPKVKAAKISVVLIFMINSLSFQEMASQRCVRRTK